MTDEEQVWVPMPPEGRRDLTAGVKELRGASTHSHPIPELSQLTLWKVQSKRLWTGRSALHFLGAPAPAPGWPGEQAAEGSRHRLPRRQPASQPFSSLRTHISSVAHPSVRDAAEFYHHLIPFKGQGQAETEAGLQYQPAALKEADLPCQGLVRHCL